MEKGSFTDPRDGKVYKTVKIGTQIWMAENLNYKASNSKCYDNNEANGNKYGRLYDWAAAKTACLPGWHLPTHKELEILTEYIGGALTEGKKLKAKSGWSDNGNGTDEYGFAALPGGAGYSAGNFDYAGSHGYWWSDSKDDDKIYALGMNYNYDGVRWASCPKSLLLSVRCVQN